MFDASDEKAVLASAQDLIRDFGGSASVDAFEAGKMAYETGDAAEAEFYFAVVAKIREIQGS